MLILSRKLQESIMIGDDIEILVTEIKINDEHDDKPYVRLGISAPGTISVHRKEVYDKIKTNNNIPHKRPITTKPSTVEDTP